MTINTVDPAETISGQSLPPDASKPVAHVGERAAPAGVHRQATDEHDSRQFRRQLVATLAGALITIISTAGIAAFQWFTQSRERQSQARIEASTQFATAVHMFVPVQQKAGYIAIESNLLATRARMAARLQGEELDAEYRALLEEVRRLQAFITGPFADSVGNARAQVAAAHLRLQAAFGAVPSLQFGAYGTQSNRERIPGQATAATVLAIATQYEQVHETYLTLHDAYGKWMNDRAAELSKLAEQAGMQR